MADLQKIVEIIFAGKDELSVSMDKMNKNFDSFIDKSKQVTGPLAEFGDKVVKLEEGLIAFGVAGLTYAFHKSAEFEGGLIELSKTLGSTGGDLEEAKQKAIEYSDKYGISSNLIVSSITEFKKAQFNLADSIKLSNDAMKLSIIGNIEAGEATDDLRRILTGFKSEASDSTQVLDLLAAVSDKYAVSGKELAIGLADLAPIAKLSNMTFEETAGVLTPVIAMFGSGSAAAGTLGKGLEKLVGDSASVTDNLKALGISQTDANGKLKSGYEILGELSKAFVATDSSQQLLIASELFGAKQAAKMVEVMTNWNQVMEVTNTAMHSSGGATEELAKSLASAELVLKRIVTNFENFNTALGDKFRVSATGALGSIADIEEALTKSLGQETFNVIWDALNSFFTDAQALLSQVAKNMPEALKGVDFSGLVDSFKELGIEIGHAFDLLLGGHIDLTTVEGLREGIQRVVDAIQKLTEFTKGFIEGLEPKLAVFGAIGKGFTDMSDAGAEAAGKVSGFASSFNTLFDSVDKLKNVLIGLFTLSGIQTFTSVMEAVGLSMTAAFAPMLAFAVPIGAFVLTLKSLYDIINELSGGEKTIRVDLDIQGMGDGEDPNSLIDELLFPFRQAGKDISIPLAFKPAQDSADLSTSEKIWNFLYPGEELPEVKTEIAPDVNPDLWLGLFGDENGLIPKMVEVEVKPKLPDPSKPVMYSWVDADGNMHFSDTDPGSGASGVKTTELSIAPKLDEAKAKKAEDDTKEQLEKIKTEADTVQKAMEWQAKLDIAEVEANAKVLESVFNSIDNTISNTTDLIGKLAGTLANSNLDTHEEMFMENLIREQEKLQREMVDKQKELIEQQIELMKAKQDAIESGEPLMTISIDESVTPAIKLVLMEVLKLMQVEMNTMADQYLLAVS